MFKKLRGLFSNDLSMDLGTANTLIYVTSQRIVLNEPSVVAIKDERSRNRNSIPLAVGKKAKEMLGKAPDNIKVIRPMKDGVIADCQYTERMLEEFMRTIVSKTSRFLSFIKGAPRVLVCVPYGSTPVERNAIRYSVIRSGAREVFLILVKRLVMKHISLRLKELRKLRLQGTIFWLSVLEYRWKAIRITSLMKRHSHIGKEISGQCPVQWEETFHKATTFAHLLSYSLYQTALSEL